MHLEHFGGEGPDVAAARDRDRGLARFQAVQSHVARAADGGLQLGLTSPQMAAQELADSGFTLYIIAIGSTELNGENQSDSGLIYEPVNLGLLQQVAEIGHGQLFHATDTQVFRDALSTIEAKHRKPVQTSANERLVEVWYPLPLALALLLILLALLGDQIFASRSQKPDTESSP